MNLVRVEGGYSIQFIIAGMANRSPLKMALVLKPEG